MYGINIVTQSVPTGLNRAFFLGGNSRRVSLVISTQQTTLVRVASLPGSGSDGHWISFSGTTPLPLIFSSFGPAMQQPVFVSHTSGGNVTVTVTEIYRIAECF